MRSRTENGPSSSDNGQRLLDTLLAPAEPLPLDARQGRSSPRRSSAPAALERPELPLPERGRAPLAIRPIRSARPRTLSDEWLLVPFPLAAGLPERMNLPAGPRGRVPSPDVGQPLPLPILARPTIDRVATEDPTAEISAAAALTAPLPERKTAVPFVRLNLPDPFEHRATAHLRAPLPDNALPAGLAPRLPKQAGP